MSAAQQPGQSPETEMIGAPDCARPHDECRFVNDGPPQSDPDWTPIYDRQGRLTNQPITMQPMRCTVCDRTFTRSVGGSTATPLPTTKGGRNAR